MNAKLIVAMLISIGIVAGGLAIWLNTSQADPPMFARVVIGPDKDDPTMVHHFIIRGEQIFVDKNKDDVPQLEERLESDRLEMITDDQAGVTYQASGIRLAVKPEFVSETLPQQLSLIVDVAGLVTYQQNGSVVLSTNPQSADWIHFAGPMRLMFAEEGATLECGAETDVRIWIGTEATGSLAGTAPAESQIQPASLRQDKPNENTQVTSRTRRFSNIVPIPSELVPQVKIEIETDQAPFVKTWLLDDFC